MLKCWIIHEDTLISYKLQKYGRHWISLRVRIVASIQKTQKGLSKNKYIYPILSMCYVSYVTFHISLVTCHLSTATNANKQQTDIATYRLHWPRGQFSVRLIRVHVTQWFQGSILVVDLATYRLNLPRGQFSENHLKCITRWEGRDGITITILSRIQGLKTRPTLYKKTLLYRFEMN